MEEQTFSPLDDLPFSEVLTALLDVENVLDPLHLYRLSDISPEKLADVQKIWHQIDLERRRALVEDLEDLTDSNPLLSF